MSVYYIDTTQKGTDNLLDIKAKVVFRIVESFMI